MNAWLALAYSFMFGLLHGILPDEHTWPITFSYAIGGGSGRAGMRAALYFAAAFTVQRAAISELARWALAPLLLTPLVNQIVYVAAGAAMFIAGAILLRTNRYAHLHLVGHHHADGASAERTRGILDRQHHEEVAVAAAPPAHWALVHGFIAGFGFGGFSLFINTVAAPAMPSLWLGFLPGLLFGLGTTLVLMLIGAVFGASLHRMRSLTPAQIRLIGAQTGGKTLFFGGLLFVLAGAASLLGLDRGLPVDLGYVLVGAFMVLVAVPAFFSSWRQVRQS